MISLEFFMSNVAPVYEKCNPRRRIRALKQEREKPYKENPFHTELQGQIKFCSPQTCKKNALFTELTFFYYAIMLRFTNQASTKTALVFFENNFRSYHLAALGEIKANPPAAFHNLFFFSSKLSFGFVYGFLL